LTPKGIASRARIVEAAADLTLARGVGGTSLNDIQTSKGQLFHYFPGGKAELIAAIAELQAQRVLDAQRPYLDELDTWESWDAWRMAVLAHYGSQPHRGCPVGALTAELVRAEPARAGEISVHMDRWRDYLEAGLNRMKTKGLLRKSTDPRALALSIFASLHGGLALTAMMESIEPLEAALDGALATLHASAAAAKAIPRKGSVRSSRRADG
jgi:AcrR family transcriptional regulator